MIKKILFILVGVLCIILIDVIFITVKNHSSHRQSSYSIKQKMPSMILFYSDDCSHCHIVKKFIIEHQIDQILQLEQKEVSHHDDNLHLLMKKAKACHLNTDAIGVPFLWNESKCLVGDKNIIHYFNQTIYEK